MRATVEYQTANEYITIPSTPGVTVAHPNSGLPIADRFWMKVQKAAEGCWLWTGATGGYGYGRIVGGRGRRTRPAHHVAWELANGPIPPGKDVLHSCDNPPCVRADHLFLGTHAENMRDMYRKGRGGRKGQKGAENHFARLTEAQVAEIRALYATGSVSQAALGRHFGVCRATIGCITRGKTWN
jgi:hypothetical protein